MPSRFATFVIAVSLGAPAIAAAQPARTAPAAQAADAARVRVQSRTVEREREHQRTVRGSHEETEALNRTVKIGSSGEVILSNLAGDITVSRGSGNEVQINAVKVARGRNAEDAREMLGLVRVDINERGSRVEARTVYPSGQQPSGGQRRNVNVAVNYIVTAPAGTRVTARSLSGDVKVTDIRGEISAQSTSGNVTIINAERITGAKSTSGNIEVTNSSSETAFEAQSISGSVRLRQVKALRIQAGSISGNVVLGQVEAQRIDAQSISGDIEFASPFVKGGRYDFNSHAGTVRIIVVGGSGFELEANTFSGSIQADPSLKLQRDDAGNGRRRQRTLRAVHGDGSALIGVTTFSGSVVITRK